MCIQELKRNFAALFICVCGLTLVCSPVLCAVSLVEVASSSIGASLDNQPLPVWNFGGLITLDATISGHPAFTIYDSKGRAVNSVVLTFPGASSVSVWSYSRGSDGTIALCGEASDNSGRGAPFVASADAGGNELRIVRTDPYYARKLTIDSKGTIWTVGNEFLNGEMKLNMQGHLIRSWSKAGILLGRYIKQSDLLKPKSSVAHSDFIRPEKNGVAWFAGNEGRYFEISSDGILTSISGLNLPDPHLISGMAITDSGQTFLSYDYGNGNWSVALLDRVGKQWISVASGHALAGSPSSPILIWGADGDRVVARQGGQSGDLKFLAPVP